MDFILIIMAVIISIADIQNAGGLKHSVNLSDRILRKTQNVLLFCLCYGIAVGYRPSVYAALVTIALGVMFGS